MHRCAGDEWFEGGADVGRMCLRHWPCTPAFPCCSGDCGGHRAADARALSRVNDGSWGVPPAGVSPESAAAARASAIDVSAVDWDTWFFGEGMPPVEVCGGSSKSLLHCCR